MTKSSKYWDKRSIARLTEAERLSAENISKIHDIYKKAYRDIEKDIQNVYDNYSKDTGLDVQKLKELLTRSQTKKTWEQMKRQGLDKYVKNNYKVRISRLEQIQAQIYAKAKLIAGKENIIQTENYKGIIHDSYYKAVYDTQMGTGYNFSFSQIDKNLVDRILTERWSGENYSKRIWENTDILADSLSNIIGSGLLTGASIEKISKQIRDRFNVGQYYSDRLVRTESSYFHNQADAMAYEEMGIDKYVFVAVLDSRTSLICQSMDNKVFEYKKMKVGENYPPLHPNCRSTTRGYLGEEAEKMLQRRARNSITGENETIDNMSYKEWMNKYSEPANYKDITNNYLKKATPNSHKLKFDNYFMSDDGVKHPIKGKEVAHPIPKEGAEYERALWIKETFGGDIHLVPRITTLTNDGVGVSTPDFRWNGQKWDLKTPGSNGKFDNSIERFIKTKKAREQAKRFIIDFKNIDKTDEEIIKLTNKTLKNPHRDWIKELMIVKGDRLIKIYSKIT